jgi:serine/threonine protein kinase
MTMTDERDGIADYKFLRQLGAGSHGVFYLAHPPKRLPVGAEFVAVKVLSGGTSQDVFRWAHRELAAFAALSRATALVAMAHASRATHALHEAGIAHRDIKPGNVLLYPGGAKLADLGLSHVLRPGVTITRMGPAGDIGYLDPSLIRGDRPSRASDVFSLGATLHYAVAGEGLYGPLPDDDPLLAMRRVMTNPPTISARVDPDIRKVIAWAIAANPAERPATALQLAERIEELALAPAPD